MCLTIKQKFRTRQEARDFEPLIAEKEIKVYKLLNGHNESIYRRFQFEKGYQYTENTFSKIIDWQYENFSLETRYWQVDIHKGLHAFKSFEKAKEVKSEKGGKIIEMYIPKNSKYYLGDDGDIVSNNLVWY